LQVLLKKTVGARYGLRFTTQRIKGFENEFRVLLTHGDFKTRTYQMKPPRGLRPFQTGA
jgi:hypothetical protein